MNFIKLKNYGSRNNEFDLMEIAKQEMFGREKPRFLTDAQKLKIANERIKELEMKLLIAEELIKLLK
jgi:ABC-type oligopeptide transport system ATPase subunit